MGAAWLLPRLVGFGRATEMLMTGDFVSAQRAFEIGLYNEVVPEAKARRHSHFLIISSSLSLPLPPSISYTLLSL
jgi:enoyl-CoA hydratase/carnithine racemase